MSAAVLGSLPSLHAATVLAIDFGNGPAQSGFTAWNAAPSDGASIRATTFTTAVGVVSATLSAGAGAADLVTLNTNYATNSRLRTGPTATGTFTYTDLLNDRVVAVVSTGGTSQATSGLLLQLGGLPANTTYTLQLWGYEANNIASAKTVNFYNLNSGADVLLGGYTTTANQTPTTNDDFSITTTITTDALGNILLKSRSNYDGIGIFNGLRLSEIPEPTSASLLLIASAALIAKRRRTIC